LTSSSFIFDMSSFPFTYLNENYSFLFKAMIKFYSRASFSFHFSNQITPDDDRVHSVLFIKTSFIYQ